jgi:hypothetical protein
LARQSDSDDDDDEELELMREYMKIKKEREEERLKEENAKIEELKRREQEEIMTGNPLLNRDLAQATQEGAYSLKRKWTEETVFRH